MKIKTSANQTRKTKPRRSPDLLIKSKSKNKNKKFNPLQYLNALIDLTNDNQLFRCQKKHKAPYAKRDLSSALTSATPIYDKTIESSAKIRCKSSLSQQNKKKSTIKGLKNILKVNLENVITEEKDNMIKFTQQQSRLEDQYLHIGNKDYLKQYSIKIDQRRSNQIKNKIKSIDFTYQVIKIQRAWRSYQTYKMVNKYYKYFKRTKKQQKKNQQNKQLQRFTNSHQRQQYLQQEQPLKIKKNNQLICLNNYYDEIYLRNDLQIKENKNSSRNNQIFNKTLKINIKKQQNKYNFQKNRSHHVIQNQDEDDLNLTQKLHKIQQYVQRSSIQQQFHSSINNICIQQIPTIQMKKTCVGSSRLNKTQNYQHYQYYVEDKVIPDINKIKQNWGENTSDLLLGLLNSTDKLENIISQQTERYDEILNLIEMCSLKKVNQQQVLLSLMNKFEQNKNILELGVTGSQENSIKIKSQDKIQKKENVLFKMDKGYLLNSHDIINLTFSPISPPSKQMKNKAQQFINNNKQVQTIIQNDTQTDILQIKSIIKQKNVNEDTELINGVDQRQQILLNNSDSSSKMIEFCSKQIINIELQNSENSYIQLFNNISKINNSIQPQYFPFNVNISKQMDKLSQNRRNSFQSEQNLLSNDSSIKKLMQFSHRIQNQSLKLTKIYEFSEQKLLSSTKNKELEDNEFYTQIQKVNVNDFYNSEDEDSSLYSFGEYKDENEKICKLFEKRIEHLSNKKQKELNKLSEYSNDQKLQQNKQILIVKHIEGKYSKQKRKIIDNKKKYFQALRNIKKQALHFQRDMISSSDKKQQQKNQKSLGLVRRSFSAQSIVIKCILAEPAFNEFNIAVQYGFKPVNNSVANEGQKDLQVYGLQKHQEHFLSQSSSSSSQSQTQYQQQQLKKILQQQIQQPHNPSQTNSLISIKSQNSIDLLQQQLRKCSEQIQKAIQQELINQILQQIYLSQPILKLFKPFIEEVFEFSPILDSTVHKFIKQLGKFYPSQDELIKKINQKINPSSIEILRLIRDYDFQIDEYDLVLPEEVFKLTRKSIEEEYSAKIKIRKNKRNVPNTDIQNLHLIQKMYEREQQKMNKIQKYMNYERDLKIMYLKSVFNCLNEFLIEQKSISTHMYTRSTIGTGELTLSIKQFNNPCDSKDLVNFLSQATKHIEKLLHHKCMLPSFKNHREIELFQKQMLKMIKFQLEQTQYKWVNYMDEVIQIWNEICNQIVEEIFKEIINDLQGIQGQKKR